MTSDLIKQARQIVQSLDGYHLLTFHCISHYAGLIDSRLTANWTLAEIEDEIKAVATKDIAYYVRRIQRRA